MMKAKHLENFLVATTAKTDISQRSGADMVQRFQKLRDTGLLTKGRGKNAQLLSMPEIVAGILSLSSIQPGYSGLAAKILMHLRPVGGIKASFENSETFAGAIEKILESQESFSSLIKVRFSVSEFGVNSNGFAAIEYRSGNFVRTAYYVRHTALSLFQQGAEKNFNPIEFSAISVETILGSFFFLKLRSEIERTSKENIFYADADTQETDDEEDKDQKRATRLGLTSHSNFLNIGVDNQVNWPNTETLVEFDKYKMVLMPKTRENTTSIHIDLHVNRINIEDAHTVFNRFLSLLTWCNDQFAITQDGWAGNPVPVGVPKRNLAFTTAYHWVFNRKMPVCPDVQKALAFYRQGRNAEQNFFVSYAVLSYYKVIEIKHGEKKENRVKIATNKVPEWLTNNYEKIKIAHSNSHIIQEFEIMKKEADVGKYLNDTCRIAAAHAIPDPSRASPSDPDNFHEIRRLHVATDILRLFARLFIKEELKISEIAYDGS